MLNTILGWMDFLSKIHSILLKQKCVYLYTLFGTKVEVSSFEPDKFHENTP